MKLAICDDMKSLFEYYKKVFSEVEDVDVVGIAQNSDECKEMVRTADPDVLLLDIQMRSNEEGIDVIEDLLKIKPGLKIVMLTVHKVEDYVFRAFALGAKDFIYKTASDDEIVTKVLNVYNDKVMLNSDVSGILAKKTRDVMNKQKSILYMINQVTKLSQSEISVLRGVYYGKTYRDIALERFVEEGTVRTQASGILRKFEINSMKTLIKELKKMELFEFIDLYCDNNEEM